MIPAFTPDARRALPARVAVARTPALPLALSLALFLALSLVLALAALPRPARADSVTIVSSRDNTLYESANGTLSNGAGDGMFAGRTNQLSNSIRRALVRFDVASAIPAGSTVQAAVLQLLCTTSASGGLTSTALHRVLADWGEGASNAGFPGGGGAPAAPGDATWTFRFYATQPWAAPGGDFSPAVSAFLPVTPLDAVTIGPTPGMVADVQGWLDAPATNFGWLLQGDESVLATANRFQTHDAGGSGVPKLVVTYLPPATPARPASWGRVKGDYR